MPQGLALQHTSTQHNREAMLLYSNYDGHVFTKDNFYFNILNVEWSLIEPACSTDFSSLALHHLLMIIYVSIYNSYSSFSGTFFLILENGVTLFPWNIVINLESHLCLVYFTADVNCHLRLSWIHSHVQQETFYSLPVYHLKPCLNIYNVL